MPRLRLAKHDVMVLAGLASGTMDPGTRIEHITALVPFGLVMMSQTRDDGSLRVVLTDEGRAALEDAKSKANHGVTLTPGAAAVGSGAATAGQSMKSVKP